MLARGFPRFALSPCYDGYDSEECSSDSSESVGEVLGAKEVRSVYLHVFALSSDWFTGLSAIVVSGLEGLLWIWFYDTQLKTPI